MKRRVAIILALLVLGAIVNVGVAWGCAVWMPQQSWLDERPVAAVKHWPAYLYKAGWEGPVEATE